MMFRFNRTRWALATLCLLVLLPEPCPAQAPRRDSKLLEGVRAAAFNPDGKRVLMGSDDNTAILWTAAGAKLRDFRAGVFYSSVFSVAFTPDGKHVLTGSQDGNVKLWDIETGKEVRTFRGHTGIVCSLAFSPDGKVLLSGATDKTAILWDATTGKKLRTLGP